jgi:hypothetical protein
MGAIGSFQKSCHGGGDVTGGDAMLRLTIKRQLETAVSAIFMGKLGVLIQKQESDLL